MPPPSSQLGSGLPAAPGLDSGLDSGLESGLGGLWAGGGGAPAPVQGGGDIANVDSLFSTSSGVGGAELMQGWSTSPGLGERRETSLLSGLVSGGLNATPGASGGRDVSSFLSTLGLSKYFPLFKKAVGAGKK